VSEETERAVQVMGIVNVTPDSFSDGGRYLDHESAIGHGRRLLADGADILDIGGESTRPGAQRITPEVERDRVIPVIEALAEWSEGLISIDTMNASTALAAVAAGARIVNDVSGGLADPDMLPAVATTGAEIALGHWRGPSVDMYRHAAYDDIIAEVVAELTQRMADAVAAGIPEERMIVDPGIGFGKRGGQNWDVLRRLPDLSHLGPRLLVGTSRKRFLTEALTESVTETSPSEPTVDRRDLATAVTSVLAARAGVWAVRVHDVAATRDALRIAQLWTGEAR
jgi:dihydropteroate synthase